MRPGILCYSTCSDQSTLLWANSIPQPTSGLSSSLPVHNRGWTMSVSVEAYRSITGPFLEKGCSNVVASLVCWGKHSMMLGGGADSSSDSESESEIVGITCFEGETVSRVYNGKN